MSVSGKRVDRLPLRVPQKALLLVLDKNVACSRLEIYCEGGSTRCELRLETCRGSKEKALARIHGVQRRLDQA